MKLWDGEKGIKNKLDTVSVWDLMENNFYVPDYQRGYRWTETEVTKLLDDLLEYTNEYNQDASFYCMQPLVVYYNKDEEAWEVIDGQQRLTTLYLLLNSDPDIIKRIKKNYTEIFKLSYQSRPDSQDFLKYTSSTENPNIRNYIDLLIDRKNEKEQISVESFPQQNSNVDYHHICNSLLAINNYFRKNRVDTDDFLGKVLCVNNKDNSPIVKFVWYDVSEEIDGKKIDSEEIFSRLNVGKIGLTNAELIKALFLNRVDKELKALPDDVKLQIAEPLKTKISTDWDVIEHSLLDADFWSFIYGEDDGKYDTRIEFLFDLIQEKTEDFKNEDYFTFNKYADEFKLYDKQNDRNQSVSKRWKQVTDRFYLYKNWYENKELYHLIGFLRYRKIGIEDITAIQEIAESNSDFVNKLRKWCVKLAVSDDNELKEFDIEEFLKSNSKKNLTEFVTFVSERLYSVNYDDNYYQIKDTLLLFNILTTLDCEKESVRFSFKDFYDEDWDIEHVRSQTDKGLSGTDRVDWILTNLGYFSGIAFPFEKKMNKTIKDEYIAEMLKQINKEIPKLKTEYVISENSLYPNGITAGEIVEGLIKLLKDKKENIELESSDTYKQIREGIIKEDNSSLNNKNGIHNLVLLDQGTNRGYKNAYFPVKRKWINSREKNGVYILPCTKNVFSKTYSSKLFDLMNWADYDANKYIEEIKRCLTKNSNI